MQMGAFANDEANTEQNKVETDQRAGKQYSVKRKGHGAA
jgi:hypothetical protein